MVTKARPRREAFRSSESIPFDRVLLDAPAIRRATSIIGRVLLIDDHDVARRELAENLRVRGWEVFGARDLQTGIDLAIDLRPQAIITELQLPDVRGFYFARSLRSVVDEDIKLIALTRMQEDAADAARMAGFDIVFQKPVNAEHLHRRLLP